MQAPGTGAREETLSPGGHELVGPIIKCEVVILWLSGTQMDWVSHCGLRHSPESPPSRVAVRAHVDKGNPGKTVKAERSVLRSGTVQDPPTVDAYAQVSASPQHRDKAPPTFMVRAYRRRRGDGWENTPRPTVLAAGLVMRLPCKGISCRHDRDSDFRLQTRAGRSSPPNTDVVPIKSDSRSLHERETKGPTLMIISSTLFFVPESDFYTILQNATRPRVSCNFLLSPVPCSQ